MAVDEENVSKVLSVLSHRLRREILLLLSEKGECSFTDLLNALNVDTGKLSFHIRNLSVFMEQTPSGKYKLSKIGENAVRVIRDVESWAEVADVNRKTTNLPIASFQRRVYAYLIDGLMILAIALILTPAAIISLLVENISISALGQVILVTAALMWGYSTLLEGFNGQSLGKRIIGLKVVRTDGKKMSYDHSAVRNFGKAFLLPFDLLVGWRIKDDKFMRYFDKFAGTTVITLRQ
jgi:uncharacterized RDD family membrane protein YckC